MDRDLEVLEDVFAYVLLGGLVILCPVLWIVALASDAPPVHRLMWLLLALAISVGVVWAAIAQLATLIRRLGRRST